MVLPKFQFASRPSPKPKSAMDSFAGLYKTRKKENGFF
jgi:hypothetical protein